MRSWITLLLTSLLLAGCAADTEDDDTDESVDAVTGQLRADRCGRFPVANRSREEGVFDGAFNGCLLARPNETGAQLVQRAVSVMVDPAKIGSARRQNGDEMFASFKPTAVQGVGSPRASFDAKVGFDIRGPFDAKGTLRFVGERTPGSGAQMRVTNTTAIGALGVNPIPENGIDFTIRFEPAPNGVIVRGTVKVRMTSYREQVGNISSIAPDLIQFVRRQINAQ